MRKPKQRFSLTWQSVSLNGAQLMGKGETTQPAYSEAQAKLFVHRRFNARFHGRVFVEDLDAVPVGDIPEIPVEAKPQQQDRPESVAAPAQFDLFPSRARQTFHTKR